MRMKSSSIIYKAFGNEERVRLLRCLEKEQCVSDLLMKCSLSQSALSQHLRILRLAGLVRCTRNGKEQRYVVTSNKVLALARSLIHLTKHA